MEVKEKDEIEELKKENQLLNDAVEELKKQLKMDKSLNESIISIRVKLQNSKIKKSGKNKYAGFNYYELSDFLPKLNELMLEEGVNDIFTITMDEMGGMIARLELIKKDERQVYAMPFKEYKTPLNSNGKASMQDIQYLGALNTYYKRYLYLNAFGITDGEVIDSMNNDELKEEKQVQPKENKPVKTPESSIGILMANLDDLIIRTDTDRESLYSHYGVNSNTEMTAEQLQDAIKILERKLQS